jgi:hypothetical protein
MNYALHIKILYGLVVIILAGIIITSIAGHNSQGGKMLPGTAAGALEPGISNVVVGAYTPSVWGVLTQVDGTTMKVKAQGGNIATVLISTDTKLQIAGPSKDPVTIQKELDAYNAQVALLMKDPVKNKAALAALYVPPTIITYPATPADFKVGDQILVVASVIDANGAYVATILTKNSPQ